MLRHTVLWMMIALLFVGIAGPGAASAQQPILIKLGNVQATGDIVQTGLKKFADLVAERTKGQVQVQIFPASQLGTEQELLEGVQLGTLHMFEGSTGSVGRFLPDLEAFAAPYIWRDTDHMLKVVRGPIGQELADRLVKAKGMRVLDFGWLFGNRYLTTKSKPIYKPEDLKGMKIRVQPTAIYLETIKAMGANPTTMDFKEVYLGLQSGVIDGQENPPFVIFNNKLFEVQKYVMLTAHITQNQAIVINDKVYQGLSPEFRKILQDSAREAGNFQNELILKSEQEYLDKLKEKGMIIIQPDVKAFREATKDVWKKVSEKWEPGLYEKIQAVR
ncbi:MAG TPA: TRAP transporter substrate-binding protein [Candidatus Methylomirabilis sp.]|nr:TRAP transporter substrate-binding protein [Candidatus Methylomirabilis sp.]